MHKIAGITHLDYRLLYKIFDLGSPLGSGGPKQGSIFLLLGSRVRLRAKIKGQGRESYILGGGGL